MKQAYKTTLAHRDAQKRYRERHPEYSKQWKLQNPEKVLANRAKWTPINSPINSGKQIKFKDRRIFLGLNPRIGVCNLCRAVIGQINAQIDKLCKQTQMHHERYHDDDPLKDTLEVCVQCHVGLKKE